ncbi:MAG: hypothetical protein WAO20_05255 [Acidobacteriota bacterium]
MVLGFSMLPALAQLGLKMGMSREEVEEVAGEPGLPVISDEFRNGWVFSKLEVPSGFQANVVATIGPQSGLCQLLLYGNPIRTPSNGEALRRELARVVETLRRTYGTPRICDVLRLGSKWREPEHWMMALFRKERVVQYEWIFTKERKDRIAAIRLSADATDTATGVLRLEFTDTNWPACQEEGDQQ